MAGGVAPVGCGLFTMHRGVGAGGRKRHEGLVGLGKAVQTVGGHLGHQRSASGSGQLFSQL